MEYIAGRYGISASWPRFENFNFIAISDNAGREGLCFSFGREEKVPADTLNHFYFLALSKQKEASDDYLIEEIIHAETHIDVLFFPRKEGLKDFPLSLMRRFTKSYRKDWSNELFSFFDAQSKESIFTVKTTIALLSVIVASFLLILRCLFPEKLFRYLNLLSIVIMLLALIPGVKEFLKLQKKSEDLAASAISVLFAHSDEVYWRYQK